MNDNRPIGIFDSGVGGTSIWKEIVEALPRESTVYLADIKNAPYGEKTAGQIQELSVKNTEKLIALGCKLIVVACNTATTNAIDHLRSTYSLPFIGIEPAIKPAALQSKNKSIGILATKGTLSSALFVKTAGLYTQGMEVVEVIGTGIVPLIESGKLHSTEMRTLLQQFLKPMLDKNIDHLVLGCSHYPYLIPVLKEMLPQHVEIIDSGEAVARQTRNILLKENLFANEDHKPEHKLYSNAGTNVLKELTSGVAISKQILQLDF